MAIILVVEDEPDVREVLCALLNLSHTVIEAKNGAEGLELFNLHHPELIITDYYMPVMSGVELIQQIRQISAKVKIVVMSAVLIGKDQSTVEDLLALGADSCLK